LNFREDQAITQKKEKENKQHNGRRRYILLCCRRKGTRPKKLGGELHQGVDAKQERYYSIRASANQKKDDMLREERKKKTGEYIGEQEKKKIGAMCPDWEKPLDPKQGGVPQKRKEGERLPGKEAALSTGGGGGTLREEGRSSLTK